MTSKKALENIKASYPIDYKIIKESYDTLEKLSDKDTPMKVKNKQHGVCPNCDQNFSFMHIKYCFECGQRLDWEK